MPLTRPAAGRRARAGFVSATSRRWVPAFLVLATFALYARAARYNFVYDDRWRIVTNDAIKSLAHPGRFFTDRTTQASLPDLHRDSWRPLVTASFALDRALYGLHPTGYRLENVLLHAVNGLMVYALGLSLLSLSPMAACFAGALFLFHPIQTESVVWIVERTNVLGGLFALLSWTAWDRFQRRGRPGSAAAAHAALVLSLLTREVAVVLPALFLLTDATLRRPKRWAHYVGSAAIVLAYLALRGRILGQTSIAPMKGGGIGLNLANVARIWPLYWARVFWPARLRVTYADIAPAERFLSLPVLTGVAALVLFGLFFAWSWRRVPRAALALGTIFLFFLPGSNLIPLTTLFGERLLYPVMIGFAWGAGLLFDACPRPRWRAVGGAALLGLLWMLTWRQLPVWRNDLTLWDNAARRAPSAWFAWACLGQAQQDRGEAALATGGGADVWWSASEVSLDRSLRNGPPVDTAPQLLILLAKSKERLGKSAEAEALAERAIGMDPSLASAWSRIRSGG